MKLTSADFNAMDKRYRATLINSVSGFKSANLIGTAGSDGQTNLAIMSSVVHLGSYPPLMGLVIRPDPVQRHTLDNILTSECYTINHVAHSFIAQAHQTAARYPRDQSEFEATGLSEQWVDGFSAPFVEQARVRLGLRLRQHQKIELNGTHLVIGEITMALLPDECVASDGSVDLDGAGTVALSGLDTYHRAVPVARMAYAKPDIAPQQVD